MIPSPRAPENDLGLVSVVVVLHDSADVIAACLASLPASVEVVVIDNASSDDGARVARAARPDATVIESPVNAGFGAGCNLGARAATRPYLAFVNPDVRMQPDTLAILLERLGGEPYALVGPALLDATGAARPAKRRPSLLHDALGLLPGASRWAPSGSNGKLPDGHPVHREGGTVASVEGACFMVAAADLQAVGGFDEDLFLYYEEESLALRFVVRGGRAIYEPRAQADHIGATSTRRVGRLATHHMHRSRVIFYRKRDGELRGRLAMVLLAAAALISLPGAAVNAVLGRAGHRTPDEVRLIVGGLRSGVAAPLSHTAGYPVAAGRR